jgi:hypothetical protein
MDSITGISGAVADANLAGPSLSISTALLSETESAQAADVEALFASVGLGSVSDSTA